MDKLDPILRETVDGVSSASDAAGRRVDVVVGLAGPADDAALADLAARGLDVRSVIGDVLTGAVALADVARLADCDAVVSIDGGGMLLPEDGAATLEDEAPHEAPHG